MRLSDGTRAKSDDDTWGVGAPPGGAHGQVAAAHAWVVTVLHPFLSFFSFLDCLYSISSHFPRIDRADKLHVERL